MNWYKISQKDLKTEKTDEAIEGDADNVAYVKQVIEDILKAPTLMDARNILNTKHLTGNNACKVWDAFYTRYEQELYKGYLNHKQLEHIFHFYELYEDYIKNEVLRPDKEWARKRLKAIILDGLKDYLNVKDDYNDNVLRNFNDDIFESPVYLYSSLPEYLKSDKDIYNATVDAICYLMKFPLWNWQMTACGIENSRLKNDLKIQKYRDIHEYEHWMGCAKSDIKRYLNCKSPEIIKKVRENLDEKGNRDVVEKLIQWCKLQIKLTKENIMGLEQTHASVQSKENHINNAINLLICFLQRHIPFYNVYNDYPEMREFIGQMKRKILAMKIRANEIKLRRIDFET